MFDYRPRDAGPYKVAIVHAGKGKYERHIQVMESPTGRSVQVHVDSVKVWPLA